MLVPVLALAVQFLLSHAQMRSRVLEAALLVAAVVPFVAALAMLGVTSWRIEVEHDATSERVRLQHHRGVRAANAAIEDLARRIELGDLHPRG